MITEYVDDVDPAPLDNDRDIIIPPRANFLWPFRPSVLLGTWTIEVQDNAGTVMETFTDVTAPVGPYRLPQDAYIIRLVNTGGTITSYRLVFQVSV